MVDMHIRVYDSTIAIDMHRAEVHSHTELEIHGRPFYLIWDNIFSLVNLLQPRFVYVVNNTELGLGK